jgi:hypothetical protein
MFQGFGYVVAEHSEGYAGFPVKLYFDVVVLAVVNEENFIGDNGFIAGRSFPRTGGEAVLGVGTDDAGVRGEGSGRSSR